MCFFGLYDMCGSDKVAFVSVETALADNCTSEPKDSMHNKR